MLAGICRNGHYISSPVRRSGGIVGNLQGDGIDGHAGNGDAEGEQIAGERLGGAGVVVEVKEYSGIDLMVIQMDTAGTMSCPLERLEHIKVEASGLL